MQIAAGELQSKTDEELADLARKFALQLDLIAAEQTHRIAVSSRIAKQAKCDQESGAESSQGREGGHDGPETSFIFRQ